MSDFTIRDKRGSQGPRRLITEGLNQPLNTQFTPVQRDGDVVPQRAIDNRANLQRHATNLEQALPSKRDPFGTLLDKNIPISLDDEEDRKRVRDWCRTYYDTHSLMGLCIDIYTYFPIQGMELQSKDQELTDFYNQLFMEDLDYENFLIEYGREYWITGEVTSLGSFNELLGVWESEEILNPDGLDVRFSPFSQEYEYKIEVPEYLKEIIDKQEPAYEYQRLNEEYPDIVRAIRSEEKLLVDNSLMSRQVKKSSPWDVYGSPHMMKAFRELLMEESLNAAQDSIADRLYSPFILARLGVQDVGDGEPWIPTQEDLNSLRNDMNVALASDFKLLVHHFGLDIKSVFGRESMPRFDNDFMRLERKMLQVWGIGESLISGSNQGAYASSALNREVVTQLMTSWQKKVKRHYRERALLVAEAQEHFDYKSKGGVRVPIYEEVVVEDPETGKQYIEKRPKLLIPDLNFKVLNLRDEKEERNFLKDLKAMGYPISDQSIAVNIDIDFDEEVEKSVEEKVQKTVSEAEYKKRVVEIFDKRGLPLPPELIQELAAVQQMQAQMGAGGPPPGPDGPPPPGPGEPGEGGETGEGGSIESDDTELPQNHISQRPEVSDEFRESSNNALSFTRRPKTAGLRGRLSRESVEDAVSKRNWTRSLRR